MLKLYPSTVLCITNNLNIYNWYACGYGVTGIICYADDVFVVRINHGEKYDWFNPNASRLIKHMWKNESDDALM